MPETAAVITTLILERPMCIPCIAGKTSTSETSLADIAALARIRRESSGRCCASGEAGIVVSLMRGPDDD
jgi:hypothetical protein